MEKIGEVQLSNMAEYEIVLSGSLNGRNTLYFRPLDDETQRQDKVSFRATEKEFFFAGILLDPGLRGQGLSFDFLRVLTEFSAHMGARFEKTTCIRKPIIAKTLKELGARPISGDKLVEILPYRQGDKRGCPNITPLSKPANSLQSESGKFFNFIPPEQARQLYPLTVPEKSHVYMYDRFCMKGMQNPSQACAEFSTQVLSRLG